SPPTARSARPRSPMGTGMSPPGPRATATRVMTQTSAGNAATIGRSDHDAATRTRRSDHAPAARTLIGTGTGPTYIVSQAAATTQLVAAPTARRTRATPSSTVDRTRGGAGVSAGGPGADGAVTSPTSPARRA